MSQTLTQVSQAFANYRTAVLAKLSAQAVTITTQAAQITSLQLQNKDLQDHLTAATPDAADEQTLLDTVNAATAELDGTPSSSSRSSTAVDPSADGTPPAPNTPPTASTSSSSASAS